VQLITSLFDLGGHGRPRGPRTEDGRHRGHGENLIAEGETCLKFRARARNPGEKEPWEHING